MSLSLVYLLSIGCWVIFLAIDWERAITIYNQRLSSPPLGLVLLLGSCIHKVTLTQSCCLDCIGIGLTKHRYCSTSTFVQLKVMQDLTTRRSILLCTLFRDYPKKETRQSLTNCSLSMFIISHYILGKVTPTIQNKG